MAEQLMTYDNSGQPLGLKDRAFVHANGDLHKTVQCWVVDSRRNVLVQRRAKHKQGTPGKWDVSCGGHCEGMETPEQTVQREAAEELGLPIKPESLHFLGVAQRISQGGKNREIVYLYLYETEFSPQKLVYQAEEIDALKTLTLAELKISYETGDPDFAERDGAFQSLFRYFKVPFRPQPSV